MTAASRAPAAHDAPTPAEAIAMQHTLNYALGNLGGRRKSWMVGTTLPASPVSPYAEPASQRKRAGPPRARLDYALGSTGRESNSTSPQLANLASHHDSRRPLPSPPAVPPSPSPSEEAVAHHHPAQHSPAPVIMSTTSALGITSPGISSPVATGTMRLDGAREAALAAALGRSRDHTNEAHTHKRPRIEAGAQAARLIVNLPADRSNVSHPTYHEFPSTALMGPSSSQSYRPPSQSLPLAQAPVVSPQAMAQDGVQSPDHGLHNAFGWYSVGDCAAVMNNFFDIQPISPSHPRDSKRMEVLKDALRRQDWPYLTMHQFYCVLTTDPQALPSSLRDSPHLPSAVRLMQETLDTNESLSRPVLEFFATFPMPLMQIALHWPQRFEREANAFLFFMQRAWYFDSLKSVCQERKYPPLMSELFFELGISSKTFQQIAFTAILRRICGPAPQHPLLETKAVQIFQGNQADFYRSEGQVAQTRQQDPRSFQREREYEIWQWGRQLQALCQSFVGAGLVMTQQRLLLQHRNQQPQPNSPSLPAPRRAMTLGAAQGSLPRTTQAPAPRPRGRPRICPSNQVQPPTVVPSATLRQVPQTTHPNHQSGSLRRTNLLPPRGVNQPQQRQPNPVRFALHQANLRSPVLRAQSGGSPLYQYIKGFVKPMTRLHEAGVKVEQWTFSVTEDDLKLIPKDEPGVIPISRTINEHSRLLRLRCIKWPSNELPSDHIWAVTDTCWIPFTYFTFNGNHLHPRKKLHHGKDLPIDLTSHVREGSNVLEIAVMRQAHDEAYLQYLVAIEVIGIVSHDVIKRNCLTDNHIASSQTLGEITHKLSSSSGDDEIAIVESSLTINLFDPFSASNICDIPARSRECLHYDCFDLETFLQTRRRKGAASVPDQWRCPICNADARPQHLIVDGFIEEVRSKLAHQGLLETRAIIMNQDGSWKPKAETRDPNGVQDRGSPDDEDMKAALQTRTRKSMPPLDVIDLSD